MKFGRNQTDVNTPSHKAIKGRDNSDCSRWRKISRSRWWELAREANTQPCSWSQWFLGRVNQLKTIKGIIVQWVRTCPQECKGEYTHTHTHQHPSLSFTYTESIKENNISIKLKKDYRFEHIQQNDMILSSQKFLGRMKTLLLCAWIVCCSSLC